MFSYLRYRRQTLTRSRPLRASSGGSRSDLHNGYAALSYALLPYGFVQDYTEAATMILRIDDVLSSKAAPAMPPGSMGGGMGGMEGME